MPLGSGSKPIRHVFSPMLQVALYTFMTLGVILRVTDMLADPLLLEFGDGGEDLQEVRVAMSWGPLRVATS
jgi:hypothetical protein